MFMILRTLFGSVVVCSLRASSPCWGGRTRARSRCGRIAGFPPQRRAGCGRDRPDDCRGIRCFFWPNNTGDFGSELTVRAADVPPAMVALPQYPGQVLSGQHRDGSAGALTGRVHISAAPCPGSDQSRRSSARATAASTTTSASAPAARPRARWTTCRSPSNAQRRRDRRHRRYQHAAVRSIRAGGAVHGMSGRRPGAPGRRTDDAIREGQTRAWEPFRDSRQS